MVKLRLRGIEVLLDEGEVITSDTLTARIMELCRPVGSIYPASEDWHMVLQAARNLGAEILEPPRLRALAQEIAPS